jgi:diaminohydroxyphosphoribosylaminopyrimidine deaminase/5-amino-6-(5-phosphoribosylamino)uracil reductase
MKRSTADDERWMREAVTEGSLGLGRTTPNPAVGCILVRGGREIARGHYRGSGGAHAEAVALEAAGAKARGSTAYLTLEPHDHQGRTPPCTQALLRAGVARVVIGCIDPNELVSGRGVKTLRKGGVDVVVGTLERECGELIRGYRRFVRGEGPLVHLKLAATADGRIAAAGGDSKWITGEEARRRVHALRGRCEAILVGIGTVLADDPRLDARLAGSPQPLRVVLDPELRTPASARLLRGKGKALVVGSSAVPAARRRRLEAAGAEILLLDTRGRRGWQRLLAMLSRRGVMELLVEGGGSVAASALVAGVVGRLSVFYSARFLGGDGVPMLGSLGVRRVAAAPRMRTLSLAAVGDDLLWEAEPE